MEKFKSSAIYFIDSMFALWVICSALRWDWINLLDPNEVMYLISFIGISAFMTARNDNKDKKRLRTEISVNLNEK